MKLVGTQVGYFILGLAGVRLKGDTGELQARTNADDGYAPAAVEHLALHNNTADERILLKAPDDLADPLELILPGTTGSPGAVLQTDGDGNLSWVTSGGSTDRLWSVDSTPLEFGSTAVVPMFALPANAVIDKIDIIVDIAFTGTAPQMSVGVNGGSASKYVIAADVDLKKVGRYTVLNTEVPVVVSESLEISYVPSGAAAGAARILVTSAIPT